jgi:hypothetical protein
MLRDNHQMNWCDRASVAALLSLALLASGCSAGSGFGGPAPAASDPTVPPPPSSPTLSQKISSFFSGSSANSPQAVANASADVTCPYIDIRQGASTLTIGPTGDNAAMLLKYQGTFVRAARECAVVAGQMVMKVGIEGRIVIGPAGGPGQVEVPLRIAVVKETVAGSKTIITKFIRIPVAVQTSTDNPTFTHIEEGLSFPMPPAGDLDDYTVYIGFDQLTADTQDKEKQKPKAKPKTKPKPTANNG